MCDDVSSVTMLDFFVSPIFLVFAFGLHPVWSQKRDLYLTYISASLQPFSPLLRSLSRFPMQLLQAAFLTAPSCSLCLCFNVFLRRLLDHLTRTPLTLTPFFCRLKYKHCFQFSSISPPTWKVADFIPTIFSVLHSDFTTLSTGAYWCTPLHHN